MTLLLQCLFGLGGAVLALVYLLRVNELEVGRHRLSYIGLHDGFGIGGVSIAMRMLAGDLPSLTMACILLAAACHLAITHRPGRKWEPPPYMASAPGQLEEAKPTRRFGD